MAPEPIAHAPTESERTGRRAETVRRMIVAIDGPAGSGKSTTASLAARRLGLRYLDTGAMYRAVTLAVLERGIDPEDEDAVTAVSRSINLELRPAAGEHALYLDGRNVSTAIRERAVSDAVSPVSRHRRVREEMVRLQRLVARGGGVVAEGRDTGSVVLPHAHVKVFLVADLATRARRRYDQLREMGISETLERIAENITTRDEIDSSRAHSPLQKPAGAVTVDTSRLTIDEQVAFVEDRVLAEAERLSRLAARRGERNPFERMRPHYRLSYALVRGFFRLVFGLRIHGEENVRFKENFIFASNHVSYFDPPVVGCTLGREVSFVAKRELFRNRLFSRLITRYNAIPVDRVDIDRATLKSILVKLSRGESILLFPEGTRSTDGALGPFKSGLGFLSLQSGVGIVPVHVTGTGSMRDCLLRRHRLEVRIGPPIRAGSAQTHGERKQAYEMLSSMARNEMEMLKREAEA